MYAKSPNLGNGDRPDVRGALPVGKLRPYNYTVDSKFVQIHYNIDWPAMLGIFMERGMPERMELLLSRQQEQPCTDAI